MGDEHLGQACGVLYELIEIDCQHTDDKGAAFQRWKYHHMKRHVSLSRPSPHAKANTTKSDFELPHVPHLTTVTSAIVPTARLVEWRNNNPEKYSIRLSDHATPSPRAPTYKGCVRSRHRWMIDHTMYVSSRDIGTQIYRRMDAKEFHERQWTSDDGCRGRKVEHRSLDLSSLSVSEEPLSPFTKGDEECSSQLPATETKRSDEILQMVRNMSIRRRPRREVTREVQPSIKRPLPEEATQKTTNPWGPGDLPIESERKIPNAVFARKFGIYEEAKTIPPYIRELPIAEAKVASKAKNNAVQETRQTWAQKGPLTPQLWCDSGLDYRWSRR